MDEGGFTSDGDVNRVTRTATTAEPPDEGHGSWDRTVLNGYKIIYVPFESGRPAGPAEDVVTAFLIDGDDRRNFNQRANRRRELRNLLPALDVVSVEQYAAGLNALQQAAGHQVKLRPR